MSELQLYIHPLSTTSPNYGLSTVPDIPLPAKISKRLTLKLCSIVSAYNFYWRQHTNKMVVREALTEVFRNIIFTAHDINSV